MGCKTKGTNEHTRKTKTHRHNQQYDAYQREGGREVVEDKGAQIYGDRR